MTETRRTLELVAIALAVALLASWAIGRTSAADARDRANAELRDSVAVAAARAVAPLRDQLATATAARLAAEAKLAKVRTSARTALATTDAAVATHRADTASTDADTLRQALGVTLAAYDTLAAQFRAYLHSDSLAHETTARERAALVAVLGQTETALTAMTEARDAWRETADNEKRRRQRGVMRLVLCTAVGAGAGGVTGSAINSTQGAAVGAVGGVLLGAAVCR